MVTRQRLTVEQYLALPEEKPYLEYVDGEVRPKVAPDFAHMVLAKRLIVLLGTYERTHGGTSGPEGRIQLGVGAEAQFLLPDVAYWAPGRPVRGVPAMRPPSLAVEIRSPGQALGEMRAKAQLYLANGVPECWLVDPQAESVEVFDAGGSRAVREGDLVSSTLPGLSLELGAFFSLPGE